MAIQQAVHYGLHFIFPLLVAYYFFKPSWKNTYLIFLFTMLVDLDHLIANPIFDVCRCSIGYHSLHSIPAIALYMALFLFPRFRILAIGLLMHMLTDGIDCVFIRYNC